VNLSHIRAAKSRKNVNFSHFLERPRILAFSAFPFIAPPLPLEKSRSNRTGSMQRALSVFGLFTRSLTG
jgi:hypothetical protein